MKKHFFLLVLFFLVASLVFSQNTESPVAQMDEAVRNLARDVHAKLTEKRAGRFTIGQFTFQNSTTIFSNYWINQLTGKITNISGRNYTVTLSGDAEWTITGEIIQVADIIRVYSRLIRTSDRAIEASFISNFQRNEFINNMLASSGSAGGEIFSGSASSWENPVLIAIGSNRNTSVVNRNLQGGEEHFFLLIPETDGRLTVETTGSIDTYMYLYNYDTEDYLAEDDDGGQSLNARIVFNVYAGTRYLAVVRGFGSSTSGPFGFRAFMVFREGGSWNSPISYEITGEDNINTVQRNLQQGDEDFFLLVPARDGRLTVETTGRIDTYLEFYDADTMELLAEDDDSGQNTNARIRINVRAGSRYIAKVRGFNNRVSGNYGFRAFFPSQGLQPPDQYEPDDEPSQAKQIEIGTSQQRTFHSADDVDWIYFQVTQPGRYVIQARGINNNRLDTYIELYDSNINFIAEDDDGGEGLGSRLSVNLNAGTYYIKVWCLDDEPDQPYIVSVEAQP
jgi:hypothetical protein